MTEKVGVPKSARKFKAPTNSKHNLAVAAKLLNQDFTATAPNQKYVGDITYLWIDEGWLYLAIILDLYSRLAVGWAMSLNNVSAGSCRAPVRILKCQNLSRRVSG